MAASDRQYRHRSSARTSVGQVRENNEDSIRLWAHEACVVGVVADGMGGAAAGEEASRLAVQAIERLVSLPGEVADAQLTSLTDRQVAQMLETAIRAGNKDIIDLARRKPDMRGMGTTVTIAFMRGSRCVIAHVGDSRAYRVTLRPAQIAQITSDHSFVEALVAAGHLTPDQAAEHPMKNVLYRALGQSEDVDVDIYEVLLDAGDRIILCSDGLTRHVTPAEIAELAQRGTDPDEISTSMIDLANERGGEDNVSVIVIETGTSATPGQNHDLELQAINPQAEETLTLRKQTLLDDLLGPIPSSDGDDGLRTSPRKGPEDAQSPNGA